MPVIYCSECKNLFISEENSAQGNTVCPKCKNLIDIPSEDELRAKKDEIYLEALHKKRIALYARDLREAKAIFEWLGNYRDAADQVESCEYLASRQEAREREEMASPVTPKRVKRIALISVSLLISLAVIITASLLLVAPIKYSIAENHYENGNFEKAAELFSEIPDYKNSKDILFDIYSAFSEKEGKIISCSVLEPWFSINENGVISFIRSKYSGEGNVTIPDVFDGITVKTIAPNAFKNYTLLKSVTLPSELSSIGTYAFYGCKNLESINIPESVTSISPYAFKDCSSLKTINIPSSLTAINAFVFSGCRSLEFPTLPDSITKIDSSAFMGCTSFKEVVLPQNVKTLGAFAFSACSSVKSIKIPATLNEIGKNAFYECDALTSVYYSGNEEEFKKIKIDSGNEAFISAEVIYAH